MVTVYRTLDKRMNLEGVSQLAEKIKKIDSKILNDAILVHFIKNNFIANCILSNLFLLMWNESDELHGIPAIRIWLRYTPIFQMQITISQFLD